MRTMHKITEPQARLLSTTRKISKHIGLMPFSNMIQPSADELRHRFETYAGEIAISLATLCSGEATVFQRASAALFLDCVVPGWREWSDPDLAGAAVISRSDPLVTEWRLQVLCRDDNECQHCGATEQLHVHHIVRWADEPMLRVNVGNGITLCNTCHAKEHGKEN